MAEVESLLGESPTSIEDRNGNIATVNTDTLGRNAVSWSGFKTTGDTVTVSGLQKPYILTWGTAGSAFSTTQRFFSGPTSGCGGVLNEQGSQPVVTAIQLPNGSQYTFTYDSTFGQVNKITYPTGGYVQYTWGFNSLSALAAYVPAPPNGGTCETIYSKPAITDRYVSFDGTTIALHQHFTYSTTWTSSGWTTKTTTVTTTDQVRTPNVTTTTVYTYGSAPGINPINTPTPPDDNQIPVENNIVYKDSAGAILRTVIKGWFNQYELACELDVLENGSISGTFYSYGPGAQITDKKEYDYGLITSTGLCQNNSIGPSGVIPTRETVTNFHTFGATPIFPYSASIVDRPSSAQVYGNGTLLAETDYGYDETAVAPVSSLTQHDETNYPSTYNNRGNLTTSTVKCFQACPNAVTSYTNDETGQVASVTDPNLNLTSYSYADSFLNTNSSGFTTTAGAPPTGNVTNAYLTHITRPLTNNVSHIEQFSYGYNNGQLTQSLDENSQPTSYKYDDSLSRLTESDAPDGGQNIVAYNDSQPSPSVTQCQLINGVAGATCSASTLPSGWKVTTSTMDGMGHVVQTALNSDPEGPDYTDSQYDGTGHLYTVSNPHRSTASTTDGTTTYTYDGIGRTIKISEPDSSVVTTSYSGNQTTVSDELGNQRTSVTDALGRLTKVLEDPGSSPHLNFESDYQYNALGNLLCAVQKGTDTSSFSTCAASPVSWRPRSFVYDSLSRLTSATNPESGTITYGYDANGNLSNKTSPSPNQPQNGTATVTTNYTYDAINRFTGKTYTDTYASNPPNLPVKYGYDGKALTGCPADTPPSNTDSYPKGRRTSMCDGAEAATWTHDQMGRIKQEVRSIGTILGQHDNDTYNLDGSVATTTSLGFQYVYTYSAAGRPISAVGGNNFVKSGTATYAPFGGLTSAQMGPTPITITNVYNSRLQPLLISAKPGASTIMSLCYDFHLITIPTPNTDCSLAAGSGDNGNVFQIVNKRDNNRSQNFLYDSLNRISQAYTSGPNWGETFSPSTTNPGVAPTTPGIDAWGNLTNRSGVTGKASTEGWSCGINANNQLTSCSMNYDPAGNMINNGTASYAYDAENRLITTAGMSYKYDGDGKRVEKCTAGTTPGTCATNATGTLYWTGFGNETLAETDLAGNVLENYIFFNGKRIARREPGTTPTIHFYFSDYLGSHGVVTGGTGTCEQDIDYYPYGGVENDYCGTVPQRYKFTGKERDNESGNDYFGARYYSSPMGRFMSPDWAARPTAVPYAVFGDPQSLNLYGYVRNDPVSRADADGHCWLKLFRICDSGNRDARAAPEDQSVQQQMTSASINRLVNNVNVLTSPVQPLAKAIQKLPDVDVNASATVLGVTKSTDGSTSLTPAVVGASVDVKATLVKNPTLEVGDAEVGLSKHTAVNGSLVLNSEGKPRLGSVGASVGVAWPEAGRVSGSISLESVTRTIDHAAGAFNQYVMNLAFGSGP